MLLTCKDTRDTNAIIPYIPWWWFFFHSFYLVSICLQFVRWIAKKKPFHDDLLVDIQIYDHVQNCIVHMIYVDRCWLMELILIYIYYLCARVWNVNDSTIYIYISRWFCIIFLVMAHIVANEAKQKQKTHPNHFRIAIVNQQQIYTHTQQKCHLFFLLSLKLGHMKYFGEFRQNTLMTITTIAASEWHSIRLCVHCTLHSNWHNQILYVYWACNIHTHRTTKHFITL